MAGRALRAALAASLLLPLPAALAQSLAWRRVTTATLPAGDRNTIPLISVNGTYILMGGRIGTGSTDK